MEVPVLVVPEEVVLVVLAVEKGSSEAAALELSAEVVAVVVEVSVAVAVGLFVGVRIVVAVVVSVSVTQVFPLLAAEDSVHVHG